MGQVNFTPTTASQDNTGQLWSNVSDAISTGTATFASVSLLPGTSSGLLTCSGTAPINQLPGGATIVGVEIGAQAWGNDASDVVNSFGATIGSTSSADTSLDGTALGTTAGSTIALGSSSTFPAGMSGLTASDVNGGIFSISLSVKETNVGPPGSGVDANDFSLTVYYTLAPNQVIPHAIVIPAAYPHWLRD